MTDKIIDYSFLHFGGLYGGIVSTVVEACRRFTPELAMTVIHVYLDLANQSGVDLKSELELETGVRISSDDLVFLDQLAMADALIKSALRTLKGEK